MVSPLLCKPAKHVILTSPTHSSAGGQPTALPAGQVRHPDLTDPPTRLQVVSPLVYRLAKYVILSNVRQPGTKLHARVQKRREFYDRVHARMLGWLQAQPPSSALHLPP